MFDPETLGYCIEGFVPPASMTLLPVVWIPLSYALDLVLMHYLMPEIGSPCGPLVGMEVPIRRRKLGLQGKPAR